MEECGREIDPDIPDNVDDLCRMQNVNGHSTKIFRFPIGLDIAVRVYEHEHGDCWRTGHDFDLLGPKRDLEKVQDALKPMRAQAVLILSGGASPRPEPAPRSPTPGSPASPPAASPKRTSGERSGGRWRPKENPTARGL